MANIPDPMPAEVSAEAWEFLGRVVRERREFIGFSQEELTMFGGPGKSTVSKIERAAQPGYPPRTQQQVEKALGWDRGAFRSILLAAMKNYYGEDPDTIAIDFVEAELPDLTKPVTEEGKRLIAETTAKFNAELIEQIGAQIRAFEAQAEGLRHTLALLTEGEDDGTQTSPQKTELERLREKRDAAARELSEADANLAQASLLPEGRTDEASGESEGDAP